MNKDVTGQYRALLKHVLVNGTHVVNERTGVDIIQYVMEPYTLSVNVQDLFRVPGNRQLYPHIAAAENAWQLMGTQDASFINKYAPKLWSKFTVNGVISSAYGYRMRQHFADVDQIEKVIMDLKTKSTSRQNLMVLWDPAMDGIWPALNVPCITMVVFNIEPIHNRLMMHVHIRSSDLVLGLPYDIMVYCLLHCAIVNSVDKLRHGIVSFVLNNQHMYWLPDHKEVVYRTIAEENEQDLVYEKPNFFYL